MLKEGKTIAACVDWHTNIHGKEAAGKYDGGSFIKNRYNFKRHKEGINYLSVHKISKL